jgi:ABC-type transporter Mla subunit MlaD
MDELEQSLDVLIQQNKENFDSLEDTLNVLIEQNNENNPNDSLDNLLLHSDKVSKLLNQTIKEGIGNLHKVLIRLDSKEQGFIDTSPLVIELKNSSTKLDNLLQAVKGNKAEKLSGVLTDIKDKLEELNNFDFDKFKEITDKQTSDLLKATYKANLDKYKKPEEALAVKLYDKDGDIIEKFGGGGGGYPDVRVKNVNQVAINPATEEKQDTIITNLSSVSSSVATYATQLAVKSTDSTITYIGKAVAGSTLASASWQIKRMTDTSGDLSIQFADGDTNFNNIWNNRESLSYS